MTTDPLLARERRWRRASWLILLVVLVALLAAAIIGWTVGGARQVEYAVNQIHARGWRARRADFSPPAPIPDEQNAAFFLRRAADEFKPAQDYRERLDHLNPGAIPLSDEERRIVAAAVAANAATLADARRARSLPAAVWIVPLDPLWNPQAQTPEFSQQRELATFLGNAALLRHVQGDDAEAVALLRDLLRVGRSARQILPDMIGYLVGIGIEGLATDHARQLAQDLSPAGAAEARTLIAELLNDSDENEGWRRAMEGEHVLLLDGFSPIARKPLIGPYYQRQQAGMLLHTIALADAVKADDFQSAKASIPPLRHADAVLDILAPAQERALAVHYRIRADRRSAALLLALRLYQLDHGGALPATLDDLVPKYLPAVPMDPFAAGGKPFKYSGPTAADPFVYSVADNGTDESASTRPVHKISGPDQMQNVWDREDTVFYLRRRPKPPPEEETLVQPPAGAEPDPAPSGSQ